MLFVVNVVEEKMKTIKEEIVMSYVDEVIDMVVTKNPAQPEFH